MYGVDFSIRIGRDIHSDCAGCGCVGSVWAGPTDSDYGQQKNERENFDILHLFISFPNPLGRGICLRRKLVTKNISSCKANFGGRC